MFKAAAPTHCEFIKHLGLRKAASEVAEFTNSTIRSHWHFALHHIQNKSQFVGTAIRRPQLSAWFSMTFTTCACFQDYAGLENVHFKSNEFPWFSSIVWTLNTWATWLNRVMDLVGGESHHWTFWELEHLSVSYFTMHMLTTGTMIHSFLPERDYVTFGSLLSQFRLSVVCLSVCNVGAPYSGGWIFRQNFFTAVYDGHPLTSVQNFTEILLGEPLRRER